MERRTESRRRGFTLIEIMAVVLIIGLLTTLVGIAIVPQIDKSRVSTARVQVTMLDAAIETYRMDAAVFPTTDQRRPMPATTSPAAICASAASRSTPGATSTSTSLPASTTTTPTTSGRSVPTVPPVVRATTRTSATGRPTKSRRGES